MRIPGSDFRTHNGHPAPIIRHDSDGHFRWAIVECFQPLVKNPNKFGARDPDFSHAPLPAITESRTNYSTPILSVTCHRCRVCFRIIQHRGSQCRCRTRYGDDALGYAALHHAPAVFPSPTSATPRRRTGTAGCRKADAWSLQQFCRVCAGVEPGDQKEGRRLVRAL
jgi:hypothetical protein